ncbi:MAG TPA: GAF domain-containing sensor histidine kinase [Acidimicrobiales bacterium]|jgi:signal transduction histidine kinase|nr:GAF domain-containing sensor histidine kinase [Acidimicrobiales bacterium]
MTFDDESRAEVTPRARVQQLLGAILAVGSGLDLSETLERIIRAARELVDAKYAALGVLDETHTRLSEFITVGIDAEQKRAIGDLPHGHGILGLLIVEPKPLRLPRLDEHPDSYGFPPGHPKMKSFLGVPIRVRDQIFGNLYLTDKTAADEFTEEDEELIVALAAAAGVAIENSRLHSRVREISLLEDRERIARDLHDTVIQRLFAIGLGLQGTVRLAQRPEVAERIQATVDDLDETVKQIRTAIFGLEASRLTSGGLRDQVLAMSSESAGSLGFTPHVLFDGPVDTVVPDRIAEQLLATLREAVSNAARHARATRLEILVATHGGEVLLQVTDDGLGFEGEKERGTSGGHGLGNMRKRARDLSGDMEIGPGPRGGTRVTWRVPLTVSSAQGVLD